jgi:poly(beta-D-mannuronate) C5 epimerase
MQKIKLIFFILFFIEFSFAKECYSILTETGLFTPVAVKKEFKTLIPKCNLLNEEIKFDNNLSYIGCSNKRDIQYLYEKLKKEKFNFKNERIVKHPFSYKDIYLIFPKPALIKRYFNLSKIYKKYSIESVEKLFLKSKNDVSVSFLNLSDLRFLPIVNLYSFYKVYKESNFSQKVIILYNGSISLE